MGVLRLLLLILFGFPAVTPVFALDIPSRPQNYVTDKADLLSESKESSLNRFLAAFEKSTTHQMVVATFPGLDGESLEDFSIRLAEKWKIGQQGRDNGVIFLIFKNDRRMRMEVGYGLEALLPDALAGRILQEVVTPYFARGDYETGIEAGVNAVAWAIETDDPEKRARFPKNETQEAGNRDFAALILIFFAVIVAVDQIRYFRYFSQHRRYPERFGFMEWWFRFAILCFILNLLFRAIYYGLLSSRGGYYGSRSGFGGFSGGGGRFGGGGASGRW